MQKIYSIYFRFISKLFIFSNIILKRHVILSIIILSVHVFLGFEPNILSGAKKLIISGAPIVIEFWPYALKRNDLWKKMQEIIKKFKFFYDISEDTFRKKEINQENIQKLFSGWDEEEPSKHALFTDLLLLPNK